MITLKLHYTTEESNTEIIKQYQREYYTAYKVVYNLKCKGLSNSYITTKLKEYKNLDLINSNSWLRATLYMDVSSFIKKREQLLSEMEKKYKTKKFKNYKQKRKLKKTIKNLKRPCCFNRKQVIRRSKGNINNEEFRQLNNIGICSVGDMLKHANRLFQIVDENTIIFKPNRKTNIELALYGHKNYKNILKKLKEDGHEKCLFPLMYRLDKEFVYISYEETFYKQNYKPIENRVISIDMNPNYIGYSIIDWEDTENGKFKIIDKGVYTLKSLNDFQQSLSIKNTDKLQKYITDKRIHETYQVSKNLINKAKHYRCKLFAVENLSIDSKDIGRGRKTNRLCMGQWNRDRFIDNLQKRCNMVGIKLHRVPPEYTSFLGNIIFRYIKLPDMILASIEISRRCYEFYLQYINKTKTIDATIRFPKLNNFVKNSIEKTMEVLSIPVGFENYLNLYWYVKKNLENKYRVPLDESKVFRQKHFKYQLINNF